MEEKEREEFIVAELLHPKQNASTMHNIMRPSIEGLTNDAKPDLLKEKDRNDKVRHKTKSKEQSNQLKASLKCVRIMVNSNKSLDAKSYSCQNISSANDQNEAGSCSIDEIDLGASQNQICETSTTYNLGKKSNMAKIGGKKVKSFREIHLNAKSQKSIIKSSRSIKFSDKKDVFMYKCENRKQNVKRKIKSFKRVEAAAEEGDECCQLI